MTSDELRARFIPFAGLQASTEAFIDYAIPECGPKRNYALIGPGVSQNPNQPVALREPHGFQVGAVSLPHGRINPPHMHFTCEVFICMRGHWRIQWGFNPEVLHVDIGPGDVVSVPTWIYRGFTNIGEDEGFLLTALGRDVTGGVLWGPDTVARAAANGVYLTADHRMIDVGRGEALVPDTPMFEPMTPSEIAALRAWTPAEMAERCVRHAELRWSESGLLDGSASLAPVLGLGLCQQHGLLAPVLNSHGLSIEWLRLPPGGGMAHHRLAEKQVLTVWRGELSVELEADDGRCELRLQGGDSGWDTLSVPATTWRQLHNPGAQEALVLVMTAGDHRKAIDWDPAVHAAAAARGWTLDADGFVAPQRFVQRAQA